MPEDRKCKNLFKCELCGKIIDSIQLPEIIILNNHDMGYDDEHKMVIERLFHLCDKEQGVYGHLVFVGAMKIEQPEDPTVKVAEKIVRGENE